MTDYIDDEYEEGAVQKSREQADPFDLSIYDDEFENATIEDRTFEPVPDGKYQVTVERAELTASKTSNKPMLKWTLRIIAPNHVGRLLWRNNMIASPDNIRWLKTDLNTCGINIRKLSELPDHLEDLLDTKLEVTVKNQGDNNQNIYLNRLIEPGRKPSAAGAELDRELDKQAEELFD